MTDAPLVSQPSAAPTRKVAAGTLGAALATVAVLAAQTWGGVEIPPGFEGSLAVILGFVASYFVRERDSPLSTGT